MNQKLQQEKSTPKLFLSRNARIYQLRKEGIFLASIAKRYKITPERVRQIARDYNTKLKYCKKHSRSYHTTCTRCVYESTFQAFLEEIKLNPEFKEQIIRLSSPLRTREMVLQRAKVVKKLRDSGLSYSKIGRLLHRDHTSIIYLYKKYAET